MIRSLKCPTNAIKGTQRCQRAIGLARGVSGRERGVGVDAAPEDGGEAGSPRVERVAHSQLGP
jgi:hypothetical protein